MSDASVHSALRSDAPLVVVEAPPGCGKTHRAADYARDVAAAGVGRLLILTHTHAACSVFAERTKAVGSRVEMRTVDSLIGQVAGAYHLGLGFPADTAAWARHATRSDSSPMARRSSHASPGSASCATSAARSASPPDRTGPVGSMLQPRRLGSVA